MTIILFLVDTSVSMCQRAFVNGVPKTYLDIAKGAIETFLKYRQRTMDCFGDRYMLLTFDEPPVNVKAGWKENHATFMNELKNLQSHGLTSMGESLRNAFDLLNLNRMQSGIDTFGQGRYPFYLEPAVIIVITDGGQYTYSNGVHQEILIPLIKQIPGTMFTKEPFRWDQRLFALVLRMPGNKIEERVESTVPHDDSPIERMCEVTGGRSYRIRSHHVLNQSIENILQKMKPGVVLQFEPQVPKENNASETSPTDGTSKAAGQNDLPPDIVFQPVKKMIYVQRHITQKTFSLGHWPLPEPYWSESSAITLPPRDAHPKLKVLTPAVDVPLIVHGFPVDKYEIEVCSLTLQILSKREVNKCWQVILSNETDGVELPFGYLKAKRTFNRVHLYVLAHNYPNLLPLLHDLVHKHNMSPPSELMYKLNSYVRSLPSYYCPLLFKALVKIRMPHELIKFLLPDNVENCLSPILANQLKLMKNTAKHDQENLCRKVYKQLNKPKPPYRQVETAKLCSSSSLRRDLVRHPMLRNTFAQLHAEIDPAENYTMLVPQLTRQSSAKSYRNPFDIPRRDLLEEIARMREALMRPTSLVNKDSGRSLPIADMGNYQDYFKNKYKPLREIEPKNVRQHLFGNPFKKSKHMVMVDEADLSDATAMKSPTNATGLSSPWAGASGSPTGPSTMLASSGSGLLAKKHDGAFRGRKRAAGPLPASFEFRRLSRSSSPASSFSDSDDSCSSTPNSFNVTSSSNVSYSFYSDLNQNSIMSSDEDKQSCASSVTDMDSESEMDVGTDEWAAPEQSNEGNTFSSSSSDNCSGILFMHFNGPRIQAAYSTNLGGEAASLDNPPGSYLTCGYGYAIKSQSLSQSGLGMLETSSFMSFATTSITNFGYNDNNADTEISSISSNSSRSLVTLNDSPDRLETINDEQLLSARKFNIHLRLQIFRDIRRPGQDYSQLLDHLNLIRGDHKMKLDFVNMCIEESKRFRRHRMVCSIQDWWQQKQLQQQQQEQQLLAISS